MAKKQKKQTPVTPVEILENAYPEETEEVEPEIVPEPEAELETPTEPEAEATPQEGGDNEALKALIAKLQGGENAALANFLTKIAGADLDTIKQTMEMVEKVERQGKSTANAKALVQFDTWARAELGKVILANAVELGADLTGQRVVCSFPAGEEPKFSRAPIGKGKESSGGGNGTREGFPAGWGKTDYEADSKTQESNSPNALAETLGYKYNGQRSALHAFLTPKGREDGKALTDKNKVYVGDTEVFADWNLAQVQALKGTGKVKIVRLS